MARNRETKIELTAYDDLFQTDESREEAKLSKIRDIPISEIDEFPDHPFKVLMDGDMEQLVESIKRNGVMTPATVRLKEDGRYELISGHRRKKACEIAGLETLKCEVKDLTRDEAIIVMVESNLQRSVILPSEKAFAYKMRLEAMNRQGQVTVTKTDAETGSPQGNASLAGAVYGIYKGEELIDTYTTDENGQFTTKYYICDNDWTVREISPSEGYLLDTAIHKVGAEPELYTVELNSTANDVNEQVIKGNIALIKHTDNGETQIETPEELRIYCQRCKIPCYF